MNARARFPRTVISLTLALAAFSSCRGNDKGAAPQSLPNAGFLKGGVESALLANIAHAFPESASRSASIPRLSLEWPLKDSKAAVLTRFGTPTIGVESRTAPSARNDDVAYLHEALDIVRSSPSGDASVRAPVGGTAVVVGQSDSDPFEVGDSYDTVIALHDSKSDLVVGLLHVVPSPRLFDAKGKKVKVKTGDILGTLADVSSIRRPEKRDAFRHTHLFLVAQDRKRVVDPAPSFSFYRDNVKPSVVEAYALDASSKRVVPPFSKGDFDIVLVAFDRDGTNQRNFEISALEFDVVDEAGKSMHSRKRCSFDGLTGSKKQGTELLLDLGSMRQGTTDSFVGGFSNADDPSRVFRYAITQVGGTGAECEVVSSDADGYVRLHRITKELTVKGRVWDGSGNVSEFSMPVR